MLDNARRYEMIVRPRGRTPADEYYHNGAIWIEGREGNNYTIDIRNNTPIRALFIVSVDGLDVLAGQPAGPNSQGYVVNAYDTVSIPGWKLNDQQAAEFFFSRSRDSYVNAIGGSTSNTGVIGAMVFSEYQDPGLSPFNIATYYSGNGGGSAGWPAQSLAINNTWVGASLSDSSNRRIDASMVKAAAAAIPMNAAEVKTSGGLIGTAMQMNNITSSPVTQDVGTGFGNATQWQTQATQFRRANPDQPDAVLAMYYNTARNLEKMGIRLRTKRDVSYQANPFPAYPSAGCKPPSGWNG
jgi:hypothetical protein